MPEYSVDSADAGSALLSHVASMDRRAQTAGAEFLRAGHEVTVTRFDDSTILGEVHDSRVYTVKLLRDGRHWQSGCSCPLGGNCQHVVATALRWLARGRGSLASTPEANPPPRLTFRQQWEPALAAKLGRPLSAVEGSYLGNISSLFHHFRQNHNRVRSSDLARLGFPSAESRLGPYNDAFVGWWEEPPRDPLELWQYVAYDLESSGVAIPEFLRSVTDTRAIHERIGDRERRAAVQRWTDRFKQLSHQPPPIAPSAADQPPPQRLDLRIRVGERGWQIETRATEEASWTPAPRTFLDQYVKGDSEELMHLDASPAVFAFLTLCLHHRQIHYSVDLQPTGFGGIALLRRILNHRLVRTLLVDSTGRPLEFALEPLVWQVVHSSQDSRDYEITLRLPDGTALPPGSPYLPGPPDYYFHRNIVYVGPPALDGVSASGAIVPGEVIERPANLRLLHQRRATLPPELAAKFIVIPLRARIECMLEKGVYDGPETFALRLYAKSPRKDVLQVFTAEGWIVPTGYRSEPESQGRITTFDLGAASAVASRLEALRVVYSASDDCWTRRMTRTFPEEFLAWREALPPEVEVVATGELASLLDGPVRAKIDFSLVESKAHRDWFDLALALKPEDSTLTPQEIALLLKARGKLVRLPGKGWKRLQVEIEGESTAALEAAGFDRETLADAALRGEKQRFHALQLASSAVADLLPERQANALRSRAHEIARPQPPPVPVGLRAELRPYQREGFEFLTFLSANRLGGVLADDMGLGKTVQALAWLLWLAETSPDPAKPLRALVVCPKTVVGNWEAETARFAPSLSVVRFSPDTQDALFNDAKDRPRIVVANYTQLRLADDFFKEQRWDAVILDEGQFIKTPTSKVAQVARDLPSEQRLILTGTPIENRLLDLWSLFAFALPGLLGPQAAFKRLYSQDNPLALTRLRARVRHFLLRRTKAQVASDLPPRTEEDIVVELEGDQRTLYEAELKRARAQLLKVENVRQFDKARFNILASLLRLRQICCHPALIDSAHASAPSAKLDALLEHLEELRDEGHQVLVFSQFVEMLELIRTRLVAAEIGHLMLTGQTENRDELVRQFQSDKQHSVFLLSLKAAGFGLNLTAASYVVLYDPWWNPAVEAQAIDRTHRIGQTVPVNAYRLIARNTIEEKIRALQREKSVLAGAIVQEESLATVLDLDSLRQILA